MPLRRATIRLLLPLLLTAGVALWVTQCGQRETTPALSETRPAEEPPPDPDIWAAPFRQQRPPPETLQPDGALLSGTLENGLRYQLMDQPHAPDVSLRLVVLAGSLHEEEHEQGWAHFVEHMAFQGSQHFKEGQIMATFERLGLKTGDHTNAFTSRDSTFWKLDIVLPDDRVLDTAFTFLRDVTDGILFRPESVEAERRVVLRELEERLAGDDIQRRRERVIFPEVPAAQRSPIGTRETITTATPQGLRAFWQRHYVPGRMVVAAAGNVRALRLEERIRETFSSLPPHKTPKDPAGDPLGGAGVVVECLNRREQPNLVRISLAAPQPAFEPPDDLSKQRRELVRRVATSMLRIRMDRMSERQKQSAAWRYSGPAELTARISWLQISGETEPQNALSALKFVAREWRRAIDHGFTDLEFHAARLYSQRQLLLALSSRLANSAAAAADSLVDSIRKGSFPESPEDELNRARTTLASLTRHECQEALREDWSRGVLRIIIDGANVESLAEAAAAAVQEAWKEKPAPHPEEALPKNPDLFFPREAARVTSRAVMPCEWMEARLDNGVLIRLKPQPGLGGCIVASACMGFGAMSLPADECALRSAAERLAYWHPLEGISHYDIHAAMAPEEISHQMSVEQNCIRWTGMTSRQSLPRQLALLAACIDRPGFVRLPSVWRPSPRDKAWDLAEHSERYTAHQLASMLYPGDARMQEHPAGFESTDSDRVAHWLGPVLRNGRLCVILSGDFDPLAALESIRRTFGRLAPRTPWDIATSYPPLPQKALPSLEAPAEDSTAMACLAMPLPGVTLAIERTNWLLAAEALKLRMRAQFRERTGVSYSPSAQLLPPEDSGRQWLTCWLACPSERLNECAADLRKVMDGMGSEPLSADEWLRVARPFPASLIQNRRRPMVWQDVLLNPDLLLTPVAHPSADWALSQESTVRTLLSKLPSTESASELKLRPKVR